MVNGNGASISKAEAEAVVKALRRNGFEAEYADNAAAAKELVLRVIPQNVTVGFSDSATIKQMGIVKALEDRGTKVIFPFARRTISGLNTDEAGVQAFRDSLRRTLDADVYLAGVNAVTRDGKLVYIDGTGNRVSALTFAVQRPIVIAGTNKIVDNAQAGIDRIKDVISPEHARRRKRNLPCAKTLKCSDCKAPERQCNITMVLERRPRLAKFLVILVGEDLGLGWDPAWPEERISRIRDAYYEVSEVFKLPPSFLVTPQKPLSGKA